MMRSADVRREWAESVGPGRFWHILGAVGLALLGGCGGDRPPDRPAPSGTTVSGTVTWQGKPLALGTIGFVPAAAGEGEDASGEKFVITNGRYEVPDPPGLAPGSYKVRIHARGNLTKQGPAGELPKGIPDFNPVDPRAREQIPEKYNDETTLTAEIVPGSNTKNFELTGTRSTSRGPARRGSGRPSGRDPF
jgi:hypothetical protein